MAKKTKRIRFLFAWYDIWVGAFWDQRRGRLYLLPIPCVGIVIQFSRPPVTKVFQGVTYYPNEKTGGESVGNTLIEVVGDPPTAYVRKCGPCASSSPSSDMECDFCGRNRHGGCRHEQQCVI